MKWLVLGSKDESKFEAEAFLLLNGALLFYSDLECAPSQIVVGFASGVWDSFEPDDD